MLKKQSYLSIILIYYFIVYLSSTYSQNLNWNKYDFIPGDVIIFEDNQIGEKNGEFPSRWDLNKGTVEIANFEGENVIYFINCNINGTGGIVPLIKDNNKDYLPEVFTVEFDAYFETPKFTYKVNFVDYKNQDKKHSNDLYVRVWQTGADGEGIKANYIPGFTSSSKVDAGWRHIAISFNKRALKVYIDDTRVLNVPNIEFDPSGITLAAHNPNGKDKGYVKNFKIAQGGVPLYEKVVSDGRIITHGIKFDVNKSVIKPESYGTLNEIFNIMKNSPEIKFIVEGHTDSDGDDKANLNLSEVRAKAVVEKLIEMGIDKERLQFKGMGETKPIDKNNTPEGKANNRRVEFVKF